MFWYKDMSKAGKAFAGTEDRSDDTNAPAGDTARLQGTVVHPLPDRSHQQVVGFPGRLSAKGHAAPHTALQPPGNNIGASEFLSTDDLPFTGDRAGFSTWPGDLQFVDDGFDDKPTPTRASPAQALADWVAKGTPAEPLDYDRRADSLVLIWDDTDAAAHEPQVRVIRDPDDPAVMRVLMNGQNVADVYGDTALTAADLTVIPLSSAMIAGLTAAPA
ncbi:hypothetical protein [uncultured Roseobacter sp.]|uniref:hypothetical protein n=1 Tax=uncultured Roseobacter sp. TaxID=114847 RepID=UPI0026142928|nr:hypothetical protein [uncultured Roseobacter sp.]